MFALLSLPLLSWALLAAADPQPAFVFKWKDKKGVLHVSDRLDDVPAELRPKFEKRVEELKERDKKKPPKPSVAATPTPPANNANEKTAYQKMKEREIAEKQLSARGQELRLTIAGSRATQTKLLDEKGYLAANPVLNAAQPARVQRMKEIDDEIAQLDSEVSQALNEIRDLVLDAQSHGYPEEWVTGD
jgi:Skp family chaperone for outer membrane proteins